MESSIGICEFTELSIIKKRSANKKLTESTRYLNETAWAY